MYVSESLKMLCEKMSAPLYIVGGYVRNSLMGLCDTDVDICGSIGAKEFGKLSREEYAVSEINERLGTVVIKDLKTLEKFEYTTFRVEQYKGGNHVPYAVQFTSNLELDAKRRDFTVNAIYYDIMNQKLIDPLGGIKDIKAKKLVTCDSPELTFSCDGLRIMRMARQACSLGFSIEEETLIAAKAFSKTLADISSERIRDELNLILQADARYGIDGAQATGLELLHEVSAFDYFLPELKTLDKLAQRPEYHCYDALMHTFYCVKCAHKDVRLAALFHDIAKGEQVKKTGRMAGHDVEGARMTREILSRLRYSNQEISQTARLVDLHMRDMDCGTSEKKVRVMIVENSDILEKLMHLKQADFLAKGKATCECATVTRWKAIYKAMQSDGTPFSLKELKLPSEEAIRLFDLKGEAIGMAMKRLHLAVVKNPLLNETKESNIACLKGVL